MLGIAVIVALVLVLGTAFFACAKSGRSGLRRWGPWYIAGAVWMVGTIILSTYDSGLASLIHPIRKNQISDNLFGACVDAALVVEALLISRWTLTKLKDTPSYFIVFGCTTIVAWLVTYFSLWGVIPSS